MPKPKKLTDEDVRLIRMLYKPPVRRLTMREIGEKFGISTQRVSQLLRGQSYRLVSVVEQPTSKQIEGSE